MIKLNLSQVCFKILIKQLKVGGNISVAPKGL